MEKGLLGAEKTGEIIMKKLSFFADALQTSVLSVILLMSACMIGFTSCSDDDEEDGEIIGTWQSVSVDMWEKINGEISEDGKYEGPYTGATIVLTADGRILITDEGETESATYKFTGSKLIIKSDGETSEVKVSQLTESKLVLEYLESDEDYQYYMKAAFTRVK